MSMVGEVMALERENDKLKQIVFLYDDLVAQAIREIKNKESEAAYYTLKKCLNDVHEIKETM